MVENDGQQQQCPCQSCGYTEHYHLTNKTFLGLGILWIAFFILPSCSVMFCCCNAVHGFFLLIVASLNYIYIQCNHEYHLELMSLLLCISSFYPKQPAVQCSSHMLNPQYYCRTTCTLKCMRRILQTQKCQLASQLQGGRNSK